MRLHGRLCQARKLAEKCCTALARQAGQLSSKISEKEKGTRGGEFLALEEHGRTWPQEQQGRQGFVTARAGQNVTARPVARVGNLVMVLQKGHKRCRLDIEGRGTTPLLLPHVALPLVEIAPLEGRN